MKLLLQRVKNGAVHVDGQPVANIAKGLVVLIGFGASDTIELPTTPLWRTMIQKMIGLRIFSDQNGTMNIGLQDANGSLLLIPQFTLYAETRRGKRPSFTNTCPPAIASRLFDHFVNDCKKELCSEIQTGIFGADMDVSLTNWGPVTIMLDSTDFL